MKNLISLNIDKNTKIVITSKYSNSIKKIYPYSDDLHIILKHKTISLPLSDIITLFDLEQIILDVMKKASLRELQLPIHSNDLGIEFNNYWFKESTSTNSLSNKQQRNTEEFELFECENAITFLYNDKNSTWLQVSTKYKYFFSLNQPPLSYQEWLPHYKVLYKQKIDSIILQQWISQIKNLSIQLRKNVDLLNN